MGNGRGEEEKMRKGDNGRVELKGQEGERDPVTYSDPQAPQRGFPSSVPLMFSVVRRYACQCPKGRSKTFAKCRWYGFCMPI